MADVMRTALLQMTSSDDPAANLSVTRDMVAQAVSNGARFVTTPEVTNCVSASRTHQRAVLQPEAQDITLAGLREEAARHGIWLLIGSLALTTDDPDGRFANRSILIAPDGSIAARYDKIHMFDVDLSETESFRESAAFRPGTRAVLAQMPFGGLGMTVCYDLRFPHLFRQLVRAGAQVIAVPAAFSPESGAAHWEPLLRARAIETGCYVLAPAQTGTHPASRGKARRTHGHALAVSPWGEVLADAGIGPGLIYVDLDPSEVAKARRRIPAPVTETPFGGP